MDHRCFGGEQGRLATFHHGVSVGPATNTNWDAPFKGYKGSIVVPGPASVSNQFDVDLTKFAALDTDQHPKIWVARVVPLDQNGNLAGQPSNPVYLFTPIVTASVTLHGVPAPPPPKNYPTVAIDSWRPAQHVEASDAFYGPPSQPSSIITTAPVPATTIISAFPSYVQESINSQVIQPGVNLIPANSTIYLDWSPPDEGTDGWDAFCDFVSQLGDYITSAIDWVSSTFNQIKNDAVSVVAGVMTSVGVPSSIANAVANVVVDAVMSSAGIPPSLPDMDQLENMGIGFVVDTASEEAGIDPAVVNAATSTVVTPNQLRQGINQTISQVKSAQQGGGVPGNWFVPDPAILYHPPVLFLRAIYDPAVVQGKVVFNAAGCPTSTSTPKVNLSPDTNSGGDANPVTIQVGPGHLCAPQGPGAGGAPGSSGSGSPAPSSSGPHSDAIDYAIEVRSKLPTDSTAYNTDKQNGACENMILWTGHVHIPPMSPGDNILVPVVLDFSFNGPEQDEVAKDVCNATPVKDNWLSTYSLADTGRFDVNGNESYGSLTQPWQR